MDHLCDLTTDDERLSALKRLPRTLESTYDRILERTHSRGKIACDLVQRSLFWIIHYTPGTRPLLTVQQICEAVSIEDHASSLDPRKLVDAEEILISCSSLIRLSADGDRMESAHFTVEEYLRAIDPIRKPHLAQFRLLDDLANNCKAATCLTALSFNNIMLDNLNDSEALLRWLRGFPFYYHAALCWVRYALQCQLNDHIKSMTTKLFCTPSWTNFETWKHVWLLGWVDQNAKRMRQLGSIPWRSSDRTNDTSLHRLTLRTTSRTVSATTSATTSRTTSPTRSPEVIDGSCWARNSQWVKILSVAAKSTRLHFAAMLHQEHLIVPLSKAPEQLGAQNELGTSLHCALLGTHVLRTFFLGESLEDIHLGHNPLARSTVKTLLALGADVNVAFRLANGTERSTPYIAYRTGFLEDVLACGATLDRTVIDTLCEDKRDDESIGFLRTIEVCKLPECDRPAAIALLASLGKSPEQTVDKCADRTFFSPDEPQKLRPEYEDALLEACRNDDLSVFRWVFETSGIDIDYRIGGSTFLQAACSSSSRALAEYLVSQGANVNERTTTFPAPLGCLLAKKPSTSLTLTIMKSLLAAGASMTFLDNCNNNCLMIWVDQICTLAGTCTLEEIAGIILSSQPDLSQRNVDGRTVWHILAASVDGHDMMDILETDTLRDEDLRLSINLRDNQGLTPLHVAASKGRGEMMQALIDLGSEITQRTPKGKTILHLATAALGESHVAFDIAVNADWDDAARESDGAAALIDWANKYCETYHGCQYDVAKYLSDAVMKLSALSSAHSNLEKSYFTCVEIMARTFVSSSSHDTATCRACNALIECFTLLLRRPDRDRTANGDDLVVLKTLFSGLDVWEMSERYWESVCSKAICAVLGTMAPTKDLERYLEESRVVDTVISGGQTNVIDAVLRLGIDVDKTGFCIEDLSILQRLCQCVAPKSTIEIAISRTKSLNKYTKAGESLLHLLLQSTSGHTQPQMQQEVVRLLVQVGLNVNAALVENGMTALMICSASRWSVMVDILLEASADVSPCDVWGSNALLYASEHNCVPIIESLLAHGSRFAYGKRVLTTFRPGRVIMLGPFQAAAYGGFLEVLKVLYELASVEKDIEAQLKVPSPLWVACAAHESLEVVQFLLEMDPQIDYRDAVERMTPLHVAAALGNLKVIEALLDAGFDRGARDSNGLTAETHAAIGGHQEAMRLLRASLAETHDDKVPVKQQRWTWFVAEDTVSDHIMTVVTTGTREQLQLYKLDLTLRFRSCICTPIVTALICGKAEIVEYLLSLDIRPIGKACRTHFSWHPKGLTADMSLGLVSAQCSLLEPLRRVLTDSTSAVTPYAFNYAMHSAAANGNTKALDLMMTKKNLVKHLPLIRHRDLPIYRVENGQCSLYLETSGTVLHTAVQAGRLESVRTLLQHHFDPDAFDLDGIPASHIAAAHGRVDLMELLLSHGSSVDARDTILRTTLGAAVENGQMDTLRLLLDRGADLRARDYQDHSLLRMASSSGKPAIFFALINAGLAASFEDIFSWYLAGQRQIWTTGDCMERLVVAPEILIIQGTIPEAKAVLHLVPSHYLKLHLTCRVMETCITVFYRASTLDDLEPVMLLHNAGAMVNLEGGGEGTPLMGACKAGRLDVVKYLVRSGALLDYEKNGVQVSAFLKAASYPKIQRWLLVERFTEQRMILGGVTAGEQAAGLEAEDAWTDEIAPVTLDLVLEDEVETYLKSKNWFLPLRRFVDDGQGAFDRVPIPPGDFARYRPLDFKVSAK